MDRIDSQILMALQNNARLSNKELAAQVDLAPSTCLERMRRLRENGAIAGFHAAVDPKALGIELQALITIRIRRHSRPFIEQFQEHVRGLEEVVAFYHVAGVNDFLVHVAVKDANHLRNLALDSFTARPEVEHMETAFIFGFEEKRCRPNYLESGDST